MKTLLYFTKIIGLTLFLVLFSLYYFRHKGFSHDYSQFTHPVLDLPRPLLFTRGFDGPENSIRVIDWSSDISLQKKLSSEVTQRSGKTFALTVADYMPGDREQLNLFIKSTGIEHRLILLSPHDGLVKDLRSDFPSLLFGVGRSTLTKVLFLTSMYLEPLADIRADFLVLPPEFTDKGQGLPSRLLQEIHREKKALLIDEPQSGEKALQWTNQGADGVITSHPEIAEQMFKHKVN